MNALDRLVQATCAMCAIHGGDCERCSAPADLARVRRVVEEARIVLDVDPDFPALAQALADLDASP